MRYVFVFCVGVVVGAVGVTQTIAKISAAGHLNIVDGMVTDPKQQQMREKAMDLARAKASKPSEKRGKKSS